MLERNIDSQAGASNNLYKMKVCKSYMNPELIRSDHVSQSPYIHVH